MPWGGGASSVETYEIGLGGNEGFAGRNGHDLREFLQIRHVLRSFRPDVVHFHISNVLMALDVGVFTSLPCVCSWHTPTSGKMSLGIRLFFALLGRRVYFLPVSRVTWKGLKAWLPYARGEVFFNPIRLEKPLPNLPTGNSRGNVSVVGMVGRNADQKDWPSFHKVEALVKKVRPEVSFLNAGEEKPCNGRDAINKMDLFVMTSKHEELPTTLLECFASGTPVCGFIPEGGVKDILDFSNGAIRDAFIQGRSCEDLANLVLAMLDDSARRRCLAEDGRQILCNHFDAERNCSGQLMDIYRRVVKHEIDA